MENKPDKPFSRSFIISTTVKHMLKSVDISIQKTINRIPEFSGNAAKSTELLLTVGELQELKNHVKNKMEQV